MDRPETPSCDELIALLIRGNEPTQGYSGYYTELLPNHLRRWRVWRLGAMGRIEFADSGQLHFTAGPGHYWRSELGRYPDLYVPQGRQPVPPELDVLMLAHPEEEWNKRLRRDVALVERTIGAVEYEGRPAWQFSAPFTKGGRPRLTVDAQLGLCVHGATEDGKTVFSWSGLHIEPDLDGTFFEPSPDTLPKDSWPPPPPPPHVYDE